jgi:hypothetical protein
VLGGLALSLLSGHFARWPIVIAAFRTFGERRFTSARKTAILPAWMGAR